VKEQKELYRALEEVNHIYDASGISQTISDISGNICTIAEVAQQGIMNPNFAATALVVIAQFAALSDEQVEDIGNVFKSIREKITAGLSEPEPQHVEEEGF
jgi:hypothetical protein